MCVISVYILDMRYTCNENFFENIDTEAKAYFLGLMFSDGTIEDRPKKGQSRMIICLQKNDEDILKLFKKTINFNGHLRYYCPKNPRWKKMCQLKLSSDKICQDLIRLGCVPNKSLILKWPIIPKNLIRHFIRGIFDGDGNIYQNPKTHTFNFSIYGTMDICQSINNYLNKELQLQNKKIYSDGNIYVYMAGGNYQVNKIFHYLYDNAHFYLKRKYKYFSKIRKFPSKPHIPNKNQSKYVGVCFNNNARYKPWRAFGRLNKKTISLGSYATENEAWNVRKHFELTNNQS